MDGKIIGRHPFWGMAIAVSAIVVCVVVAGQVLAGNTSGDSTPGQTATSSSVAESSVDPTSSQSPVERAVIVPFPLAAKQRSKAGAEAFYRYFMALYNYSYDSLDPGPLLAVSDTACKFCLSVKKNVEAAKSRGQTFRGGAVEIESLVSAADDDGAAYVMNVLLSQKASDTLDASGVVQESQPAKATQMQARVVWQSGRWQLRAARTGRV
ncbi:DUF6318 family protein [Kineosporia sp. A_224]|uniref:DUF6318 family protein n=1 Tax=Kineosporia sp. A_224 TaxID=1962180 RepID=UPI000B4AB918|nr:DUF6318 family protein [Kineosporia sp. A_224]